MNHEDMVYEVRSQWQEKLVPDDSWTVTEEEASDLLSKATGNLELVLQSIAETSVGAEGRSENEIVDAVYQWLEAKVALSIPKKQPKAPCAFANHDDMLQGLVTEFAKRISGYEVTLEEAQVLLTAARNNPGRLLQAINQTSKYCKVRRYPLTQQQVIKNVLYVLDRGNQQ